MENGTSFSFFFFQDYGRKYSFAIIIIIIKSLFLIQNLNFGFSVYCFINRRCDDSTIDFWEMKEVIIPLDPTGA